MNIHKAFPSKYVKAEDLPGDVTVTMDRVVMETIEDDNGESKELPVVYFANKKKGLLLNKTNATNIADQYGSETDHWAGKTVTLFPTQCDLRGRSVACIRIRVAAGKAADNEWGSAETVQAPSANGSAETVQAPAPQPAAAAKDDDF